MSKEETDLEEERNEYYESSFKVLNRFEVLTISLGVVMAGYLSKLVIDGHSDQNIILALKLVIASVLLQYFGHLPSYFAHLLAIKSIEYDLSKIEHPEISENKKSKFGGTIRILNVVVHIVNLATLVLFTSSIYLAAKSILSLETSPGCT